MEKNICNEQVLCLNSMDEFVSQLYAAMHRDQLEHKKIIIKATDFGFLYTKAKLIEYKDHCAIELIN